MMALQEFHSHNLSEKDSCMDLLKYIHKKMKQHVFYSPAHHVNPMSMAVPHKNTVPTNSL